MVALPGASKDDVLADLTAFTQELRGTVVGQPLPVLDVAAREELTFAWS